MDHGDEDGNVHIHCANLDYSSEMTMQITVIKTWQMLNKGVYWILCIILKESASWLTMIIDILLTESLIKPLVSLEAMLKLQGAGDVPFCIKSLKQFALLSAQDHSDSPEM